MTIIKTKDLIGAQLDWAVYNAEKGYNPEIICGKVHDDSGWEYMAYSPSINWALAGPIIEREKLSVGPLLKRGTWHGDWHSICLSWPNRTYADITGPTPLIAAMRCYVAAKLGTSVDVPEGLT